MLLEGFGVESSLGGRAWPGSQLKARSRRRCPSSGLQEAQQQEGQDWRPWGEGGRDGREGLGPWTDWGQLALVGKPADLRRESTELARLFSVSSARLPFGGPESPVDSALPSLRGTRLSPGLGGGPMGTHLPSDRQNWDANCRQPGSSAVLVPGPQAACQAAC